MKNHFHLRLTPIPKGLPQITPDMSGMLSRFDRYVLAHEISEDKIPHYHVYGETEECEKTVRTHIVNSCKIPIVGRGKVNGYYCFKFNAYKDPSPAYVCADGDIRSSKGYSEEELMEYIKEGKQKYQKIQERPHVAPGAEGAGNKSDKGLVDQYLDYLDEVIPKQIDANLARSFTIGMLRSRSLGYWRKRNGGLLPQASTYKRFLVSAWMEWSDLCKKSDGLAEFDIEKYGY